MSRSTPWKLAAATAMLALCSYAAMAQSSAPSQQPEGQGQPMHGRGPERELANLTRVLTLTPDQQTGVKAILDQEGEQMKALRSKAQADPSTGQTPETREARMAQFKQIHDESNTKITALLNDDQKKIFAGWTAKRTAEMQHHRGQGAPAAAPGETQPQQ